MSENEVKRAFSGGLPFTDLYLVTRADQWMVDAEVSEGHAISRAKRRAEGGGSTPVKIWRVLALDVEELELQREVIRESLVPRGTAVDK